MWELKGTMVGKRRFKLRILYCVAILALSREKFYKYEGISIRK
jgi:hypothetical protein